MLTCVQAKISGRVQGVGFRMWTKRQAERHGLGGWVRNLPDGSVEALLQGEKTQVDQMLALLREGPPASSVESMSVKEAATQDFGVFEIRR